MKNRNSLIKCDHCEKVMRSDYLKDHLAAVEAGVARLGNKSEKTHCPLCQKLET